MGGTLALFTNAYAAIAAMHQSHHPGPPNYKVCPANPLTLQGVLGFILMDNERAVVQRVRDSISSTETS